MENATPAPAAESAPPVPYTATPAAAFQLIELAAIALSQTPMQQARREMFDKTRLEEMAQTIKAHGVIEPILVRPYTAGKLKHAKYELVFGERRFSASRIAGVSTMPALVRELTDLQVDELQVIENDQREDLHPLVEAVGFEQLIKVHKLTPADIAVKIGKSRSHVYGRLKYCELGPEVRKAFYAGKIDATIALEIARHITPHDLQRQALKEVTTPRYDGEAMSFREAAEHIRNNYLVKLSQAPFDIKSETLVAAAGSCVACPKSSANQRDLFPDSASANVCTDPPCFAAKRAAHAEQIRTAAVAKGKTVISGEEAKKIAPHGARFGLNGYQRLDAEHWTGAKHVKIASVMPKGEAPLLLQDPQTGGLVEVVSNDQLRKALVAKGIRGTDTRQGAAGHAPEPAEERKKALAEQKIELEFRRRLFRAVGQRWSGGLTREDLERLADRIDDDSQLDPEISDFLDKVLPQQPDRKKLTDQQLAGYIVLMSVADQELGRSNSYDDPHALLSLAKRFKIDAKAVRAEAAQEIAPKKSAAKADEKPKAAAPAPKPAAKKKAAAAKASKTPAKKKAAKK